jgi:hypothetical protein
MAVVDVALAAAGAAIHHSTVRVLGAGSAQLPGDQAVASGFGGFASRSEMGSDPDDRAVSIGTFNGGTVQIHYGGATTPPPPGRSRPAMTLFLGGLTAACVIAFVAGLIGLVWAEGVRTYEVVLLVPSGTSIVLLVATWWWRVVDRDRTRRTIRQAGVPMSEYPGHADKSPEAT